jgi:hypothetical protein
VRVADAAQRGRINQIDVPFRQRGKSWSSNSDIHQVMSAHREREQLFLEINSSSHAKAAKDAKEVLEIHGRFVSESSFASFAVFACGHHGGKSMASFTSEYSG